MPDPQLTEQGAAAATAAAPALQALAGDLADLKKVAVGSSGLQRARQTAALLFPTRAKSLIDFPHIRKDIPSMPRNARALFRHLYRLPQQTFVIVVHKGFVLKDVVRALQLPPRRFFNNLDALMVVGDFNEKGVVVGVPQVVWRRVARPPRATRRDRCSAVDRRKTRRRLQ